ncbi:MAG: response regulator transcription factor [Desulfarculus sp.]|nr:response regulator transcription factor [Pseudomonadota bacterium]MBV1717987.1 response regulator transcription factor [Desulfarculus sp.]MBU4574899.1 response regulator transcription factor [Pseudomonadota bacterium]MBU4598026.1 response regulator transcription factor [Pseudomonadota bacterium]MBV1739399.1 response regulator transcription factor [Desulfarculus sp.]
MAKATVLVVEDEKDILDVVDFNLRQAGYRVLKATDGAEGLRLAKHENPDLVVLDLMLPGMDGKEVCRRLKAGEDTRGIPVLILTALSGETDRIIGFEIGADDYLTKPFSPRELALRVQAILRRSQEPVVDTGHLEIAGLSIDPERHMAQAGDEELDLTATEFKLLHYLAAHAGKVQTREILLSRVWGYAYEGYARTVDTHIRRLRKKLGLLAYRIETVRGIGYRFREER